MSETKWIPYDEKKDKRPNAPRPRVKHIIVYNNYSLHEFYGVIGVISWAIFGYLWGKLNATEPNSLLAQNYLLSMLLCAVSIVIFGVLEENKENTEKLIEDLQ